MAIPYEMIETPDALAALAERLKAETAVAVDTEFVWDRTYYARLGLVQIGTAGGECFLVDAVTIPDLSPLAGLLENPGLVKILHDAPQDLMILRKTTGGAAKNVFDTRLAAGFAGLASTLSLANLLMEALGVHLEKAHTRADWVKRPLKAEELEYAADDVLHLPALAEWLRERAQAAGVAAWLDEEMKKYDEPGFHDEASPEEAFRRIRLYPPLPPRQLAVLRELAAWREREAQRADRPRKWILEDRELTAMAAALPKTVENLGGLVTNPKVIQRVGRDLLAAVEKGLVRPESECPEAPPPPRRDKPFKQAVDDVLKQIQDKAARIPIDPQLVCSRGELAQRMQANGGETALDPANWTGWRAEFMGR